MYGLSEHTIQEIRRVLKSIPSIAGATLYGSRARGDYHTGSDIDIALKGDAISYNDLLKIHSKLDDLMLPYSFDISIFNRITNPLLRQNILCDGKEL